MSDAESDSLEDSLGNLQELLRKRMQKLEEREKTFKRMKKAFEEENPALGNPSDVLRLNVGGTRIDVLRRTLTSVEGSMLATRFSGRWDDSLEKDLDGNFFLDQPIDLFLPMIDYLRSQACMTPRARPVNSPYFSQRQDTRDDFFRMLEYYGMTLGIYPFGIYAADNRNSLLSEAPEYKVAAEQWTTFLVLPKPGNAITSVKSYEVILGKGTSAQVGWAQSGYNGSAGEEKGVGYNADSVALDCSRSNIAIGADSSRVTTSPASLFSIAGLPLIDERTVIRCEDRGQKWFVDGTLVASATQDDGVTFVDGVGRLGSLIPCFSVKGSLRIANVELDY